MPSATLVPPIRAISGIVSPLLVSSIQLQNCTRKCTAKAASCYAEEPYSYGLRYPKNVRLISRPSCAVRNHRRMRPHFIGSGAWKRSAVLVLSVALSFVLATFFNHENRSHYFPFIIGVGISAWYGGLVPGVAATFLSLALADYFFTSPTGSFWVHDSLDLVLLGLFCSTGLIISFLLHWVRTANATLQKTNVALEKSNAALNEAVRQLGRSNGELERFSFTVAHDLQEPLRSIRAMTELFLKRNEQTLDDESARTLGFVIKGADRMKILIHDILEFAKVNSNAATGRVDVQGVAESALRYLQEAIYESGAKVTLNSLPVVQANEQLLFRLFLNLISNALKYHGKNTPDIQVSASQEGENWVFSVSDNGIGIDPKYHDQIFDPFRRLHSRSEYQGSGVGLATCKRIVEQLNGRIWVKSQPGMGSTFYFTIPSAASADSLDSTTIRKPNESRAPQRDRGQAAAG